LREFGERQSLGSSLRFPVFLASLERDAPEMLQESYRRVPVGVRKFIEAFDASTKEAVRVDPAYDFKVYLVPKSAGGPAADLAMEFVRLEDLSPEQREHVQAGTVKVRPKGKSEHPDATDTRYCFFDFVHRDYTYTQAWTEKLKEALAHDPERVAAAWKAADQRAPMSGRVA
jgi:hypothetical protein